MGLAPRSEPFELTNLTKERTIMGLDCIPYRYPCRVGGTAIYVAGHEPDGEDLGRIDCDATREAGGCPHLEHQKRNPFTGGHVTGIFGTACWYRGKSGYLMIEAVKNHVLAHDGETWHDDPAPDETFYGDRCDNEDGGPSGTPEFAKHLREWMERWSERAVRALIACDKEHGHDTTPQQATEAWGAAIWWLRFTERDDVGGWVSWY